MGRMSQILLLYYLIHIRKLDTLQPFFVHTNLFYFQGLQVYTHIQLLYKVSHRYKYLKCMLNLFRCFPYHCFLPFIMFTLYHYLFNSFILSKFPIFIYIRILAFRKPSNIFIAADNV